MMLPDIIPASALGRDGSVAPSERIVLGGIGIGSRGWGVLASMRGLPEVQFVAVCDLSHDVAEWGAHSIVQAMMGLDMTTASPIEFE